MSKVLLINGSPHAHGCTFTALSVVAGVLEQNGIVLGSPVYFGAVSGTMTSFLNRLFYSVPAEVNA